MSPEITTALISGSVTLVTSLGASILVYLSNIKKIRADQGKFQADQISKQNEKIENMQKDIQQTLATHKEEYIKEINEIHNSITDIKTEYSRNQAIMELKIDNLEKKQDKHNNLIERTYKLEKDSEVLKQALTAADRRIGDLEKHEDDRK